MPAPSASVIYLGTGTPYMNVTYNHKHIRFHMFRDKTPLNTGDQLPAE